MDIREFNLPWMEIAERLNGLDEVSGPRNNPEILQWAEDIGGWVEDFYTNDGIPWCGLFVAHCMDAVGIDLGIKNPLSALEWNKFGVATEPCYGAVMVFSRQGGGHVALYVSEDKDTYHVLGGNQSDSVNVTRVRKDRFEGARWPSHLAHLKKPGRIVRQFDGQISFNEA